MKRATRHRNGDRNYPSAASQLFLLVLFSLRIHTHVFPAGWDEDIPIYAAIAFHLVVIAAT
jgi:hypothetical protein